MPDTTSLKRLLLTFTGIILVASVQTAWSEEYFRWHDSDGGVHYGSTPPQGVEAEKVKIFSGKGEPSSSPIMPNTKETPEEQALTPGEKKAQQEFKAAQQSECSAEQKRLQKLKANKPIRLKQDDGSVKYLTKAEIAKEVERSSQYLKDVCH